jgi:type VI secretion system secreted protein Hcp
LVNLKKAANRRQQPVALDIFLKVAGIKGESSDDQHREEIDVASFSWGLSRQRATSTGGGAGASKADFQDLHVVTNVSQASPQLFLASAAGRHIETAILTCRKVSSGTQQDFLKYTLTDVLVASYHTDGHAEDSAPVDEVSFTYAQIKVEYRPQRADGSLGAPITAGWNVKTNEPIE